MNPNLQQLLHDITASIEAKFKQQDERIEELENEIMALQNALENASACLRKASEK